MPSELVAYDESELTHIGVECPTCGTESIFNLEKDHTANKTHNCPGCDQPLLESFTTEARQNYNWITHYQRARTAKKNVAIRFYFKRRQSV